MDAITAEEEADDADHILELRPFHGIPFKIYQANKDETIKNVLKNISLLHNAQFRHIILIYMLFHVCESARSLEIKGRNSKLNCRLWHMQVLRLFC